MVIKTFTFSRQEKEFHAFIEDELSVDGEPVYSLSLHLEYLYISRYLLLECRDYLKNLQVTGFSLVHKNVCFDLKLPALTPKT